MECVWAARLVGIFLGNEMSSKWSVTPSLRVATFSHYNKMGEDVLVETDLKTKLCRHGELSSSIRTWVQMEAKARAEGAEPFKRPSTCNCIVTHGLQNHTRTRPPSPPSCMYDVLASNEAKELDVGEVGPALQLTSRSVYLAPSGTFFCQHKTRLVPITKAARPYVFKAEGGKCHCSLALPRRAAKLRLGRFE